MKLEIEKVLAFNKDQIEHVELVQRQVFEFCIKIMMSAIEHDKSKFDRLEYEGFINSRDSLRSSADGQDEEYQKHFKTEAIQHHVLNNPHHPEYWDARGEKMPVHEAISMFFDWRSRCIAKGGDMESFWPYNIAKLKKQPHALSIVEALKREFKL